MLESITLIVCLTTLVFFVLAFHCMTRNRHTNEKNDLSAMIKEKERLLQLVMDNVPFPIYCKDMDDNFRYILCNKACVEQNKRDLSGLTDFELYPLDFAKQLRANDSAMLAEQPGTVRVFRETVETDDKHDCESLSYKQFVLSATGHKLLIGVSVYQTEQNQLRHEIAKHDMLLRTVLDNIPAAIAAKNVNDDLRYVIWNKEFEKLTEIPADKILGKNDTEFEIQPGNGKLLHGFDLQTLGAGELCVERQFATNSGKTFFMRINKKVFKLGDDDTLIVDFGLDLTRENELAQRSKDLIDYQKDLIGKSQFANDCLRLMTLETDVDKIINLLLERFAIEESADRSYIYLFKDDANTILDCRYEWLAPGIAPQITFMQDIDMTRYPDCLKQIHSLNDVVVDDAQDLDLQDTLRDHLKEQSIQSTIMVPFRCAGKLRGIVGLSYIQAQRIFSEGDVRAINNITHMLELAYSRKILLENLVDSDSPNMGYFEKFDMPSLFFSAEGRLIYTNHAFESVHKYFPSLNLNCTCSGSFCCHQHTPDWCPLQIVLREKKSQRIKIVKEDRVFSIFGSPLFDTNQNLIGVIAIIDDITEVLEKAPVLVLDKSTNADSSPTLHMDGII